MFRMNYRRRSFCVLALVTVLAIAGIWWRLTESRPTPSIATVQREAPAPTSQPAPQMNQTVPPANAVATAVTAPLAILETAGQAKSTPTPLTEFGSWMEKYLAADLAGRAGMNDEGEALAAKRREFLYGLIKSDPESALKAAVPMHLRAEFPESIQALLEERVSGRGLFSVMVADYPEQGRREVSREFLVSGQRYDTYVYGRRLSEVTRDNVALFGVAVPDPANPNRKALAVHEESARTLEYLEAQRLSDKPQNCIISGVPVEAHGSSV